MDAATTTLSTYNVVAHDWEQWVRYEGCVLDEPASDPPVKI